MFTLAGKHLIIHQCSPADDRNFIALSKAANRRGTSTMVHSTPHMVILMVAASAGAAKAQEGRCPADWTTSPGVCLWPKQQAYRNISGAPSMDHALPSALSEGSR